MCGDLGGVLQLQSTRYGEGNESGMSPRVSPTSGLKGWRWGWVGLGAAMGLLFVYRLREGVEGGGGEMWCRGRGGGSASAQHAAVRYNQKIGRAHV